MRSLKSARLQNFQSHKNTLINFAGLGCLTVITGPSDSGKSAVIRALRWVFYNVPQGDGFIFNAEDKCTVTLEYDDGTKVERIRSRGGINRYVVNGQIFEGFGTGVPLEVQQATGIRKLEIGDQSFLLNLSEQLDGPFLGKSVSGPARAKVLGKLAGTEELDFANKEIGTDIYRAKRQQEGLVKDVEAIRKSLADFAWIPDREIQLAELEKRIEEIKHSQERISLLRGLYEQISSVRSSILQLKHEINRLKAVDYGLAFIQKVEMELAEHDKLTILSQSQKKSEYQASMARATILRLLQIDYAQNIVAEVQKDLAQGNMICKVRAEYLQANISRAKAEANLKVLAQQCEAVLPYLEDAEEDAKTMEEIKQLSIKYEDATLIEISLCRIVKATDRIDEAQRLLSLLDRTAEQLKTLRSEQSELRSISANVSLYNNQSFTAKREVETLESEYISLLTELGKCPTCGGEIHIEKLREVI